MTFLRVLLIILAVLWLLGRIRLGGWVRYDENGLAVKVLAGPLRFTVFPRKPLSEAEKAARKAREGKKRAKQEAKKARAEARKAKKKARRGEKRPGEEPEKKGGALPPLLDLLPLAAEAAGGLKRRIRIDELTVHLTWAAEEPAQAALGFGRANAVMGMIWPLLDHNFDVKKHDLGVQVDFNRSSPDVMCRAALTMRLGQLLGFGLRLGCKLLAVWSRSRKGSVEKQEA